MVTQGAVRHLARVMKAGRSLRLALAPGSLLATPQLGSQAYVPQSSSSQSSGGEQNALSAPKIPRAHCLRRLTMHRPSNGKSGYITPPRKPHLSSCGVMLSPSAARAEGRHIQATCTHGSCRNRCNPWPLDKVCGWRMGRPTGEMRNVCSGAGR